MKDIYVIVIGIVLLLPMFVLWFKGKFIYFAISSIIAIGIHGYYLFGPHIFYLFLLTFIVSTVFELLSLKTPLRCFGIKYWYTLNHPMFSSKIRFLGVYPLEVSLSWVLLKYMSFNVVILITQAFSLPQGAAIFLTPLVLVSLDFIMDPTYVNVKKLWQWEKGSDYFGIPLQNFVGWYLVGLLATALFGLVAKGRPVTFNLLYLLPIIFYASFIKETIPLFKMNKKMAILGSIPMIFWSILGLVSLAILYFR